MANWAKLQEQLTGKRVVKRAKHGIHFDNGNGSITANFSGKPCHFQDTDGLWKPIDTKLLLAGDGWYGSPHSDVRIHPNGQVKVTGSDYEQFAKLPSAKKGVLAGDRIIRTFPGGEQHLIMTEDGFRQEIHVEKPTFPLEKFIARQTGNLPSKYTASPLTAMDADGNSYVFTGNVAEFGDWLDGAVYPVTIDPDFVGATSSGQVFGTNADYATARSTSTGENINPVSGRIGQRPPTSYYCYRGYFYFDTSSIGAGSTVTQANLKLTVSADASVTDFDILIVKFNGGSTREDRFDNILANDLDDAIWRNSNGISVDTTYTSGNLSTAWVSKTGTTAYAIIDEYDRDGTAATTNEYISIYFPGAETEGYRPVLTVTYTAGSTGALRRTNMNAQMQSLTGGFN